MEVPVVFRQAAVRISFPWEQTSIDEKKNKCEMLAKAIASVVEEHRTQLTLFPNQTH